MPAPGPRSRRWGRAGRSILAPLYFWAATTDGNLAINGTKNVPVYMDFADTKSKLAGAFALHVEARNGRWGLLGDVNFVRLSSDADYTTPMWAHRSRAP
jgi:hypothetical protein